MHEIEITLLYNMERKGKSQLNNRVHKRHKIWANMEIKDNLVCFLSRIGLEV